MSQTAPPAFTIRTLSTDELPGFFDYLGDHLKDNGRNGTPLFQPMSRSQQSVPPQTINNFTKGLATPMDQPGWRRLWVAVGEGGLLGHIDLRSRGDAASEHRVLLGMGVHRSARRMGLGMALLDVAITWAGEQRALDWIDLEVLTVNQAARALYIKRGFKQSGEMADLFRIDGERHGQTFMSFRLR